MHVEQTQKTVNLTWTDSQAVRNGTCRSIRRNGKGPSVLDIRKLVRPRPGVFTYDPGFTSTGIL